MAKHLKLLLNYIIFDPFDTIIFIQMLKVKTLIFFGKRKYFEGKVKERC